MIPQVLEECLVVLQSCFEPGQIDSVDVLVGREIPGFRHTERVSAVDDSFQGLTFDINVGDNPARTISVVSSR